MNYLIDNKEHSEITECSLFEKFPNEPKLEYLGIHKVFENDKVILKSFYYIGYLWLDDEVIHIKPKENKGKKIDYLSMFLECLNDSEVSKHLDETYKIYFEKKWIPIKEKEDIITPLIILHFLKILHSITKKGLKKGYIKVTNNLTSKIKGRINISQTIKHNHTKNRLDKTICNYEIFSIDCIENRILKSALLQCSKYLNFQNDNIIKLLKQNLNAFELVTPKEIFPSDFDKVKISPFYQEYKEALNLAKMIFKRFGFSLNSYDKNIEYKIPPFVINMPELFERYVEVKLRKQYSDDLIAGYSQKNGNSYIWGLRPDFLVKNQKTIIDAKYKYWFADITSDLKEDYQQLSLYSRVKQIRNIIGVDENEIAKIVFVYPTIDEEKEEKDNNFCNIIKKSITIPLSN